jgi:hypothetical protein
MYFSGSQWLAAIILDVLIRALVFFMSRSMFVLISPFISVIHYALLGAVSAAMTGYNVRARFSIPFTILIANIIFFGAFVGLLAGLTKAGRATRCLVESDQCYWVNGTITELGMWALAQDGLGQIVINLIPLLIVGLLGIRPTQDSTEP